MLHPRYSLWREFLRPIILAIFVVLIFRSFFWEPFRIPSGSMEPNLLVGDFIFVSKSRYGYGPFSVPFTSMLMRGDIRDGGERLFGGKPKRGDMAVFRKPNASSEILVKRIIGLPGDQVRVVGGVLEINSRKVERRRESHTLYRETLPNGVSYRIQEAFGDNGSQDNTPIYEVPSDKYFFLGDNRDNSLDSRFLNNVGFVPYNHLVGPVVSVWFSFDTNKSFPFNVRWDRVFSSTKTIEAEATEGSQNDIQQDSLEQDSVEQDSVEALASDGR